jgi:Na+/proline symporter/nitrogen-specific signal transduction histidine kinase
MGISVLVVCSILYIGLLFLVAYLSEKRAEKGKSLVANPYIYALSLAVFCTAWTFYGSVGKASRSGLGFLPIYFGPTIFAPLWIIVLRKMILISKSQRITSIADFISSRYGKSSLLGVFVTIIAFFAIIPYISLQLKAIADSFDILAGLSASQTGHTEGSPLFYSNAFYVSMALALFTIMFGARNLEPNERHEGLVVAIAFESIVKLVAFLAVGIFVTYGIYNGFGDLFTQAAANSQTAKLLTLGEGTSPSEWFWLSIVSLCAVILLPRQFHIAIVENANPNFVTKAIWLFPLYLLIINVFVLPIALAGIMHYGQTPLIRPDSYVLELPLLFGHKYLALLVFIGGLSASTSMVIVETTALSIMLSNHIIMPPLLSTLAQRDNDNVGNFSKWVIIVRRITIFLILLLAFAYVQTIAANRELVSIGLVSFVGVMQFAPSVFGGLFWKGATKSGAIAGLLAGFVVWLITLPLPTLMEYKVLSTNILTDGYFGLWWLKPYALLGLEGFDHISHAAFWTLFFNIGAYVGVSLYTEQSKVEASQADLFVNIYKYLNVGSDYEVMRREAKMDDLLFLMNRFLGEERTQVLIKTFEEENNVTLSKITTADAELVNYVETILAGALGASSARIILTSVVKEDPIGLDEMLGLLDQTQEIIISNRKLEQTTQQLQAANQQLKELDRLKADFITTVTHELRTPMTSIRALSKILKDNKNIPEAKREAFLNIVVEETERITRLVNQVLDIEKFQSNTTNWRSENINFNDVVHKAYTGFTATFQEKSIKHNILMPENPIFLIGDSDKLMQVVVNILSNATKFARTEGGQIDIELTTHNNKAVLKVKDNGIGISKEKQEMIFERFTQINNAKMGKPQGSGLGLFITEQIVSHFGGNIRVESVVGEGATFIVALPIQKV